MSDFQKRLKKELENPAFKKAWQETEQEYEKIKKQYIKKEANKKEK